MVAILDAGFHVSIDLGAAGRRVVVIAGSVRAVEAGFWHPWLILVIRGELLHRGVMCGGLWEREVEKRLRCGAW